MIVKADISDVNEFALKYFPNFKDSHNPFQNVIVYKMDDYIIGFIIYSIIYERAEIDYIAVKEEYRGTGISKEMLDYILNDLKECKNISLEVNSNNKRAIGFYLKNGFKKVAIRRNYYNDSDGIVMVLEVN